MSSLPSAGLRELCQRVATLLISLVLAWTCCLTLEDKYTIDVLVTLSFVPNSFTIVVTESSLGIATLLTIQPIVWKRHVTDGNLWDGFLLQRVVLCGGVVRPFLLIETS